MAIPFERLEGKYEILEKMREGGMGALYKVRHRLLDEVRVIKVMRAHIAEDEVLQARFLREAKTAIRLRHSNLAQIYDFTVDEDGAFYLVMEFIDGLNLQEMAKVVKRVPVGLALEIAYQSLGVLGYLHHKKIVHRDISPDNLLVCRDDEGDPLVKLIDLGIAKVQQSEENLTATGTFLGKVRYSSPENFRSKDAADVGPRSDLYSFGVVLYELLTGTYPIRGSTISGLIAGHLMHEPVPFEKSDPEGRIPEELRAIVQRAMAKEVDDRFPSARSFREQVGKLRIEHPCRAQDVAEIFESPTLPTMKMQVMKPGSTQSHLDRNFGVDTTPSHGATTTPAGISQDQLGAEQIAPRPATSPGSPEGDAQTTGTRQQVRALLLGAEKLVQVHHYDEARLQLNAALELDPENAEVQKLLRALDAADTMLQSRRAEAAEQIRTLVGEEDFEAARTQLEAAEQRLGRCDEFGTLGPEIEAAETAAQDRDVRLQQIFAEAPELIKSENFESALKMLHEALTFDEGNSDAKSLLAEAEEGLNRQREAQRRQQEIEKTTSAIAEHLVREDINEARRTLNLARKLYGAEPAFDGLALQIEDLKKDLEQRRLQLLREQARVLIENAEFTAAVETLNEVLEFDSGDGEAGELLAAAREGLRLQEEAKRRQQEIDTATLSIDRLILAGRLETAVHTMDMIVGHLGDFDQAAALRRRIEHEMVARRGCEDLARSLLEEARKAVEIGDFDHALEQLAKAREVAAKHPEVDDVISAAADDLHERAENEQRLRAISAATRNIEERLHKDALEEAERELDVAERMYGQVEVFEELRHRLGQLQAARREAEVERLVREALGRQSSFSDVIKTLEKALALSPKNEKVMRLLSETRGAEQRLHEEKRAKVVAEAMKHIDELIAAGDNRAALAAVEAAVEELGEFSEARILRVRMSAEASE